MKRFLLASMFLFTAPALAQVCDVTYKWESETMTGHNNGKGENTFAAQPMSEVEFNHKAQKKVLSAMSKEQDNKKKAEGPMYRIDVWEYRECDGGAKVKIDEGSASIQGVSYAGVTRITDEVVRQLKVINNHHKDRIRKGHKSAWDHSKAKKVKRDDLGQRAKE